MTHNKTQQAGERITYVRLADETHGRLQALARLDGRTVAHLIRLAVLQYLNRRKSAA